MTDHTSAKPLLAPDKLTDTTPGTRGCEPDLSTELAHEVSAPIVNLSGYRFVHLDDLSELQARLKKNLGELGIKGSVMLASEGINVSLAGEHQQVIAARKFFNTDERLAQIWFKESFSKTVPFARLRVRVRNEIIAFDGQQSEQLQCSRPQAPAITPETLCQWLDQDKDMTLLDARNDYEIVSGTFEQSTQLNIKHFRHFKVAVEKALANGSLDKSKPLVTYCTGGIRCEKAAPWLLDNGFKEVYQVAGGVINYLERCGDQHWRGQCFVFDERVELTPELEPTGAGLCYHCQLAVPANTDCRCQLGRH